MDKDDIEEFAKAVSYRGISYDSDTDEAVIEVKAPSDFKFRVNLGHLIETVGDIGESFGKGFGAGTRPSVTPIFPGGSGNETSYYTYRFTLISGSMLEISHSCPLTLQQLASSYAGYTTLPNSQTQKLHACTLTPTITASYMYLHFLYPITAYFQHFTTHMHAI